jgi:hypothetical protein
MGALPSRYSFVLNPYVRERFTKCPKCAAPTRARKLPLVIHVNHPDGPRLVLLNKSCRLCLVCETLVVHQAELEQAVAAAGPGAGHEYVVLGTIDHDTWRRGVVGEPPPMDLREHMTDFKNYLKVEVTRRIWNDPMEMLTNTQMEPTRAESAPRAAHLER